MSCQHLKCAFLSTLVRTPPVPNDHEVFPCSYSVHFCRLFRSLPTGKNLPSWVLYMWGLSLTCYCAACVQEAQPRLFQSSSSILCANSHAHRRPDLIARCKPAASDRDGSTTDRCTCEMWSGSGLRRPSPDSGLLPFVRPPLWNSICMTSESCLKTIAPMHKVSKVWETHITPKKELVSKANDRELFRWSVQRRLSALSPVQTIAFLPRFIPGQRKSSQYF